MDTHYPHIEFESANDAAHCSLTVVLRQSGIYKLVNRDGVLIGPGLGNFRCEDDAREWARLSGYTTAPEVRHD